MADGAFVALGSVAKGAKLRTASGGTTTVRDIVSQHSSEAPYLVPIGVCGATKPTILSPAHAIRCAGEWTTAERVGKRSTEDRAVTYVNVQTDDYCSDELLLDSNLVVETWDGRQRDAWRPHSYENGQRVNCK